jgi:hypothetical protein
MSYEHTLVPVSRSQEAIRKLILQNGGSAVAFVSQPPREGFEAQLAIDAATYRVRIQAEAKPKERKRRRRWGRLPLKDPSEEATKRVWRVLFFHLKSVFEASASGVMERRELLMPYIVTKDGRTIADHILPRLEAAVQGKPERLLPEKSTGATTS